jgi:hypothetical protein
MQPAREDPATGRLKVRSNGIDLLHDLLEYLRFRASGAVRVVHADQILLHPGSPWGRCIRRSSLYEQDNPKSTAAFISGI